MLTALISSRSYMIVQITPIALESIKYKYYIVSPEAEETLNPNQMLTFLVRSDLCDHQRELRSYHLPLLPW